ncbi:HDOD domain-containing protein [Candidatus Sumerlaeota bacterium]|nr:HDOD domain-containing protein [Candidatus Sumerlaeota bacterium]
MDCFLEDILKSAESIPPMPNTSVRLAQVLNDSDASIQQITQLIQFDQALTADLLRLCNSAYFGFSEPIYSVKDAVVKLGTAKVFQLAMAYSTRRCIDNEIDGYDLGPGDLWRHSVSVALAAQLLAQHSSCSISTGLAFTTALLLDIGKLALNHYVGAELPNLSKLVKNESISFEEAEQQHFGVSHPEIGARIAEKWQLPACMVNCIRHHHNPGKDSPFDPLLYVVHQADIIAMSLGIGLGCDGMHYKTKEAVLGELQIDRSTYEWLLSEILEEFQEVLSIFDSSSHPSKTA